jgi:AraC-like DNA-binding protein
MPSEHLPELLQRFPAFRTSDTEVLRRMGQTVFGVTKIELQKPDWLDVRANFVQLQDIALAFASINSDINLNFPESDFIRLQIAQRGLATTTAGGQTTEVHERQACVTSAGLPSEMICGGVNERLTLRVKGTALDRMLVSLLGFKPKGRLEFTPAVNLDHPYVQSLLQMVLFLARQLDSTSSELPPLVLREFEQTIAASVLYATRHTFSHLLEQKVPNTSPREIRRAEEYITANWTKPIRIEDLVAVTDISARSLFKSFKNNRGYSPMAFAKMVRLKRAKEMLTSANPDTSVTAVAFKCGFGNLGHFAKDYRGTFGELPSETLVRALRTTVLEE